MEGIATQIWIATHYLLTPDIGYNISAEHSEACAYCKCAEYTMYLYDTMYVEKSNFAFLINVFNYSLLFSNVF